jgi:hypothetical protein
MCNHPPANDGLRDHAEGENMFAHPSRRQILRSTLASSGLGLAIGYPALTFAESAAPTPQCHDGDEATIRQTEGPYFKRSSPQRADLLEPDAKGPLVEINGSTDPLVPSGRASARRPMACR